MSLKKRVTRYSSYGLIILGLFLMVIQPFNGITGAVIDLTSVVARVWFFIGLGMFIGGGIVLMAGREGDLEKMVLVGPEEILSRIRSVEPDGNKVALISDTSSLLNYSPDQVEQILGAYENVFVPNSVLDEIKYFPLRDRVEKNSDDLEGFEENRQISRSYLDRTEKPQLYQHLLPYLNGEKQIKTNREAGEINEMSKKLRGIMTDEGYDIEWATLNPKKALGMTKEYLERHCQVSDTDVDVLATALTAAKQKKHAIINQKDIDFEHAIRLIKAEEPSLGQYLDFIRIYEESA